MLFSNLNSLASRREDLSRSFFSKCFEFPVFIVSLPHLDHRLTAVTARLRSLQTFPRVHTRTHRYTVLSYNMALIITGLKPINPSYFTIVSAHPDSAGCQIITVMFHLGYLISLTHFYFTAFLANVHVRYMSCRRPSACLSVVCNVGAPYSGD